MSDSQWINDCDFDRFWSADRLGKDALRLNIFEDRYSDCFVDLWNC